MALTDAVAINVPREGKTSVFEARLIISGVAILMLVLSAGIFRKQKMAKTCPVHNRHAGLIATGIAWGLLAAGLGLFVMAWLIQ